MKHANRIYLVGLLVLGGGLCALNASAEDTPTLALTPADKSEIDSLLGPGVVIEALPAKPLAAVATYVPKDRPIQIFTVKEAGQAERQEKHHITQATQGEPTGGLDYEIAGVGHNVLSLGSDQSLSIIQEYDLDKKVVSTFSPGEPLIVPGLAPGQSKDVDIAVAVADIDDPTDISHRGKLKVTYAYLGAFRVKVPAGTFDTELIKWTYTGDVGPATIKTAQYRFLAQGTGLVAMVEWRSISAVLVYHDNTKLGKLLVGDQ